MSSDSISVVLNSDDEPIRGLNLGDTVYTYSEYDNKIDLCEVVDVDCSGRAYAVIRSCGERLPSLERVVHGRWFGSARECANACKNDLEESLKYHDMARTNIIESLGYLNDTD